MPFGDAKVEDGTSVSKKKESVKKEGEEKKSKKVKKKVSAEPTKKKRSHLKYLPECFNELGNGSRPKTTTVPMRPS